MTLSPAYNDPEGKFAGEGLQNIDEDDDILSAMARELVERNGIGESADAIWKILNTEHQKVFPAAPLRNDDVSSAGAPGIVLDPQYEPSVLTEAATETAPVVVFGLRAESLPGRRRRGRPAVPEQASLFTFS